MKIPNSQKRKTLTQKDLELVLSTPSGLAALSEVVDINRVNKMKDNPAGETTSFARELMHQALERTDLRPYFKQLDAMGYGFSLVDFTPKCVQDPQTQGEANWIALFECAKAKKLDLKNILPALRENFAGSASDSLIAYMEKHIGPMEFFHVKALVAQDYLNDPLEDIKDMGLKPLSMLTRAEVREAEQNIGAKVQWVLGVIDGATNEECHELLMQIKPSFRKLSKYFVKNSISIGIMDDIEFMKDYLKEFSKAPQEWFHSSELKVIEAIEHKLAIQYVERAPHDATERFNALKQKNEVAYRSEVTLTYQDGSSEVLSNKKSKKSR